MPPFLFEMTSTLTFAFVNYIIVLIASGVANQKLIIKEKLWKTGMILTYMISAIVEILVHEKYLQVAYQDLHVMLLDVLTLFAGIMVVYAFLNSPFVVPSPRTSHTIKIWIVIGISLLTIGAIRTWNNLDNVSNLLLKNNFRIGQDFNSADIVEGLTIIIGILALVLALFYPETMLLSQTQIMKVAKLLRSNETQTILQSNKIPIMLGKKDSLNKYMSDVAKMIQNENNEEK